MEYTLKYFHQKKKKKKPTLHNNVDPHNTTVKSRELDQNLSFHTQLFKHSKGIF